ncbi:hypothetical protein MRX96_002795 [Rhipicephalus microplus]
MVRAFTCKGLSAGIRIKPINALNVRWKPRDVVTTNPSRLSASTSSLHESHSREYVGRGRHNTSVITVTYSHRVNGDHERVGSASSGDKDCLAVGGIRSSWAFRVEPTSYGVLTVAGPGAREELCGVLFNPRGKKTMSEKKKKKHE